MHVCVIIFMASPRWSSAFIRRIIYKFLNVCPFDYTAFAVSGMVGIPLTGLTTPVGWQLTVLSRSAIVVKSKILVAFLCCHVAFWNFSVGVGAFVIGLSQISSFFSSHLRDVEISLDMPVIRTDFENLVSPKNEICSRNVNFFVSSNGNLSVKSYGRTLFDITAISKQYIGKSKARHASPD